MKCRSTWAAPWQKSFPAIQAERPELLKKLEGFANLPTEVMLKNTIRAGYDCSFTI